MSEIKFYAPETPDFEQANVLAKLAMEQRQKASEGFKNTVKSFTDSVVKANHSLIKERLDALTPEQLQDKVAVNALVNSLTKDTGYMYDAPVIDTYVEARPDILQQRALEAEKLEQQELANQNSAFNHHVAQLKQDKEARDEMRKDLLNQHIYYVTKGDTETALKVLQENLKLFPTLEEAQAFLGLGLNEYLKGVDMDDLQKAKLKAQTEALLTQANVAQQNADTNQFTAESNATDKENQTALDAWKLANGGGDGGKSSNGSNGSKQQDLIQKTATENSLKKLNELGMPNAVEQKEDGSLGVNYNTVNSTIQNTMSNINEKYRESASEWQEKLLSAKHMQNGWAEFGKNKAERLIEFVNKYETTDDEGNKRPLRPDEKGEIYRKAVLGEVRFDNWLEMGEGDTLNSKKIDPLIKSYNNENINKANAEITAHVADTLSALSQATGMTNGQLAYELGWGKGTDMFKHLPKSIQKDMDKYEKEQAKEKGSKLAKKIMKGTGGDMVNRAVKQSQTTTVTADGKVYELPRWIAKPKNKDNKPYADISLDKYRNRFNH